MTPPPPQAARARIVYFHGNGGNLSNWSPILAGIVRRGYSVLAVDYRGYGLSTGRPTERGLYRDVDAARRASRGRARTRSSPLVYWGRSLGGAMAAYAATVAQAGRRDHRSGLPERASGRSAARRCWRSLSVFASYRFPAGEFLEPARTLPSWCCTAIATA